MTESKLFFGGMNVENELKLMDKAFSEAKPGDVIPHEDIEKTINLSRKESRYRTVISRWRRDMLKTKNLDIESRRGEGYAVLTPTERVSSGSRHCACATLAVLGVAGANIARCSRVMAKYTSAKICASNNAPCKLR